MNFSRIGRLFKAFFKFILKTVRALLKLLSIVTKYLYDASDALTRKMLALLGEKTADVNSNTQKSTGSFQSKLLLSVGVIVFFIAMTILIFQSLIIVPVGNTAVITRFGAYSREVDAGLRFRLPVLERYYIVNSLNLMEETFGFMQATPPRVSSPDIGDEERKIQEQYEVALLKAEQDNASIFASRGSIMDALATKQRLTNDYIRRKFTNNQPQPVTNILNRLQKNKAQVNDIEKLGVSLNGRVPVDQETKLITGDLNIINLTWTVQYKISDSRKYLFNSRDVQQNVKDISRSMMSEVIGESMFSKILTTERKSIEDKVQTKIQNLFDQFGLGLEVSQVIILDALPAQQVIYAFNEVNRASQDMEKTIYQAETNYYSVIPESVGKANKIVADAQAYAANLNNIASGESGRFTQILAEYKKAPAITKDRLYIEAMQDLFNKTPNMVIDKNVNGILPIFMNVQNTNKLQDARVPLQQKPNAKTRLPLARSKQTNLTNEIKSIANLALPAATAATPVMPAGGVAKAR